VIGALFLWGCMKRHRGRGMPTFRRGTEPATQEKEQRKHGEVITGGRLGSQPVSHPSINSG